MAAAVLNAILYGHSYWDFRHENRIEVTAGSNKDGKAVHSGDFVHLMDLPERGERVPGHINDWAGFIIPGTYDQMTRSLLFNWSPDAVVQQGQPFVLVPAHMFQTGGTYP